MPRRRKLQIAEAFTGMTGPQMYNMASIFAKGSHHGHYPWIGQPLINYRDTMPRARTAKEYKKQILDKIQEGQPLNVAVSSTAPPLVGAKAPKAPKIKNKMLVTTMATKKTYVGDPRFNKKASYPVKKATNRKNGPVKRTYKKPFIPKAIKKELTDIKKSINVDKATHTYKSAETSNLLSLVGRCNHANFNAINRSILESMCANLRYYDPSAPATLVTADASTGTFSRDIFFKNVYSKISLRNNYQVPCKLKVYLCKVKMDNNDTDGPLTLYKTSITDQVINASVDETDAIIHVNDIERLKDVWNIDCVVDKVLEPGQEASASHSENAISFDPSHVDDYSNTYQKVFKAFTWLIRVEGVLGHDTSADEQTILLAGIDYQVTRKAVIEYDAGTQLNDIYISEGRAQSFSNGGVCSLKPIADNIAYSLS